MYIVQPHKHDKKMALHCNDNYRSHAFKRKFNHNLAISILPRYALPNTILDRAIAIDGVNQPFYRL